MFDFATPAPRPHGESIVPMINVVFLLLIFFLMSARIAPPEPFATAPPVAGAADPVAGDTLFLAADGALAYGAARGEAVFAALAGRDGETPLVIRADAGVEAAALARLANRLAAAGQDRLRLQTVPR
ncbi:ExbD/TolR family protein [Rhodovulum euryhalinum]|uniref:Outer membrane transport energization protein ExbD n=1 Tax=Rhodovulum euryhalinum TaxID=35805 RepID=A0A4R2KCA4_9RHOB|nr:biopolymer transporter ExbD [Rhodovulum euryhalinum]TCO70504.1 outer membrane transport energization protein ExbD [Rhodovulum euryhalinum]